MYYFVKHYFFQERKRKKEDKKRKNENIISYHLGIAILLDSYGSNSLFHLSNSHVLKYHDYDKVMGN